MPLRGDRVGTVDEWDRRHVRAKTLADRSRSQKLFAEDTASCACVIEAGYRKALDDPQCQRSIAKTVSTILLSLAEERHFLVGG